MNYPQELCPICQSNNIFLFADIYQNTVTNNLEKLILERKLRFTGERQKTKFKQLILERTLPPMKPTIGGFEIFISALGAFLGMLIGITGNDILSAYFGNHFQSLIIIFSLIGYFKTLHLSYKYGVLKRRLKWEVKMKKWQESWICLACGNDW